MIETYDLVTIRAGVPMYLLARKIKAMGVKMVLCGEGSDEVSEDLPAGGPEIYIAEATMSDRQKKRAEALGVAGVSNPECFFPTSRSFGT